jgi:hypothetical protein
MPRKYLAHRERVVYYHLSPSKPAADRPHPSQRAPSQASDPSESLTSPSFHKFSILLRKCVAFPGECAVVQSRSGPVLLEALGEDGKEASTLLERSIVIRREIAPEDKRPESELLGQVDLPTVSLTCPGSLSLYALYACVCASGRLHLLTKPPRLCQVTTILARRLYGLMISSYSISSQ